MDLLVNYGIRASAGGQALVPIATQTFNYTGGAQSITLNPGIYTFEAWGASAPDNATQGPGRGAYTKGDIELTQTTTFYIYVGEGAFQGVRTTDPNNAAAYGFNGGAIGGHFNDSWSRGYSSGGGATDIRLTGGAWNDTTGLRSRIMVAGGAGPFRNGGTLTGLTGYADARGGGGGGGTQTSGGAAGGSGAGAGIFGRGGIGRISQPGCPNCNGAYGSGSGYYGAGGGWGGTCGCNPPAGGGGGSGSSFISGYTGCNAVNAVGSHTGQPNHYSGLVFTNSVMTAGLNEAHTWVDPIPATGRIPAATGHGKVIINGSELQ